MNAHRCLAALPAFLQGGGQTTDIPVEVVATGIGSDKASRSHRARIEASPKEPGHFVIDHHKLNGDHGYAAALGINIPAPSKSEKPR